MDDFQQASLDFPCPFAIRAIGDNDEDFRDLVITIAHKHVSDLDEQAVSVNASSGGNYISVHVPFTALSRQQLNGLQTELNSHRRVRFIL